MSGANTSFTGSITVYGSLTASLGYTGSFVGDGSGLTGIIASPGTIYHDLTVGYSASRHIDHTEVSITGTSGLIGGGTIAESRLIVLNTSSHEFKNGTAAAIRSITGSAAVIEVLPSGVVSGSAQVKALLPPGVVSGSILPVEVTVNGSNYAFLAVTHSLQSNFPSVIAYEYISSGVYEVAIPGVVRSTGLNTSEVIFTNPFSGSVIFRA